LLVVFTDRTLEQWKAAAGNIPQDLKNPVRNSINHAIAIPVVTTHGASTAASNPVAAGALALISKNGDKVEVGNGILVEKTGGGKIEISSSEIKLTMGTVMKITATGVEVT